MLTLMRMQTLLFGPTTKQTINQEHYVHASFRVQGSLINKCEPQKQNRPQGKDLFMLAHTVF